MVVDRLKADLLNKLINARIGFTAHLQLRKTKGYMSINESDRLHDVFFALDRGLHEQSQLHGVYLDWEGWNALYRAKGALVAAAVRPMSGHHSCPTFIAVNTGKLENCLTTLTLSTQSLQSYPTLEHV